MEHQSWEEALDIDDDGGDFPSLLRPCKRHHHSISQSPLPHHQQYHFTQTLEFHPQSQQPSLPPPSSTTTTTTSTAPPCLIPGPAGAVQAAMNRRMAFKNQQKSQTPSSSPFQGGGGFGEDDDDDLLPTQEYLRRVVENGDENDDDFTRNSWECAAEFVRINGLGDGVAIGTPLSSIKSCLKTRRVPQVVAMIKSCSPNGLGDMMVTLKDPSGTIGASIHRKVLAEEEFGRNISVGAVMILQEAVVFSPSRTAHYLSITLGNMIKVIPKDSGPPSKQNFSAWAAKHSASATVCIERPGTPQKACSPVQGRIQGILDEVRVSADIRGTTQNDTRMRNSNGGPEGNRCSLGNLIAAVEREPIVVKEGIAEVAVSEYTNNDGLGVQLGKEPNPRKQADGVNLIGSNQRVTSTDGVHETVTGFNKPSQPLSSKTTLPQWTDEQLDELFAFDSDNGDSIL